MDSDLDLISAKAMLEWIEELGISEAISEKPINRFNTKADENAKITVPRSIERLPTLSASCSNGRSRLSYPPRLKIYKI
jgi:hypothetical protein